MVLDIKMCRFDNVPWGFRLVGGTDFEMPLTVVKVTEGSIAEEAGLCEGDVIVRINDTPALPLSHDEAHQIIMKCGNVFYFGIHREESQDDNSSKHFPIISVERPSSPDSFLDVGSSTKSYSDDMREPEEYLSELCDRPNSQMSEGTEIKLVEEEIAAVLSGESEVLKEHKVMGIFPKPGVCMTSDVLRTLNEEAIKTKAEKDKENKKWTTFMQKPNRPIPKSKAQIDAERHAANAYKVQIVKSAPRTTERAVSPAVQKAPEPEPEPVPAKEPTPPPIVEEEPLTDNEVPNLEEVPTKGAEENEERYEEGEKTESEISNEEEKSDKEKEASTETRESEPQNNETATDAVADSKEATPPQKTDEELALERQLADVQRQLQALSSLPSTIQATLDAVTKQLGELLPTFRLQQVQLTKEEPREINLESIEETKENSRQMTPEKIDKDNVDDQSKMEGNAVDDAEPQSNKDADMPAFASVKVNDMDDYEVESYDPIKKQQRQDETRQMEQEQNVKKQKRHDVIEELEEHLGRKNSATQRSKRAFGPLTPSSERPVVLPGGRRWYRPKDAYNDEFIAETLSAQAELITGTTLGVNFMKYQKPEKRIDYDRSEVYKIIHHLDRRPVRGIEIRAPVVPSESDIRQAVHS